MKKLLFIALGAALCSLPAFAAAENENPKIITLSNGMQVWLDEDHSAPVIFGGVAVRAGAKDCPDTGIAHYFEHIMFKGTDKIGTTDYVAEKPILDSIAAQYALLKQTADPVARKAIFAKINDLTQEDAKYTVPNEFSQLINLFGGTGLNAQTSYDYTFFHNTFSSSNLEAWLELNSERLLNPVFRLFQGELETVYEEKNMYSDDFGAAAMEHLATRIFAPHPYAYPILGSTDNLKNPDMAAMRAFYDKYYIAGNMALILSGDFDTDTAIPLIEKYFSRIPAGTPSRPAVQMPKPFVGRETDRLKVPIPLVRAGADLWRAVPLYDRDEVALNIAGALLSNENGTGYLDRLTKEHKVMAAAGQSFALNDAGVFGVLYVPKMLVSGLKKAEERVMGAIDSLRNGAFSEQTFETAKAEYLKSRELQLETPEARAMTMMQLYTAGRTWADYEAQTQQIQSLTKADVVRAANKYFGDNKLVLTKKTGSYPKDRVEKPDFAPVLPQTAVAHSEYGKALLAEHPTVAAPRFIDPANDLTIGRLSDGDSLFVVKNPRNDIFRLELNYRIGYNQIPALQYLPDYLDFVGVDSLTNVQFQQKLRAVGATISYSAEPEAFSIVLEGFDNRFAESYALLKEFVAEAKPSDVALRNIVSSLKMDRKAVKRLPDALADAQVQYLLYGDNASQLREITAKEVKKYPANGFIDDLHTICNYRAGVRYSGGASWQQVADIVGKGLGTSERNAGERAYYPYIAQSEHTVSLLDAPKARQSIVNLMIPMGDMTDMRQRALANLFNEYVGGSMNSVLFQQIREYRAYAYAISSGLRLPRRDEQEKNGCFRVYMTTQTDKTGDALHTLDSLMRNITFTQERFDQAKRELINSLNNNYPNFRTLAERTDNFLQQGCREDPARLLYDELNRLTLADLTAFYAQRIAGKPAVYAITGDTKHLDEAALGKLGRVVTLETKEIIK